MAIEVKTKRWGNSVGVIIPIEIVERLNIKPEEDIVIEIEKKNNLLKELFGKAKSKKSAKKMVDGFRREFKSKWI